MKTLNLKEIRHQKNINQTTASEYLKISLRSYKTYENDENKKDSLKYNYLCEKLLTYNFIDETHGVLNLQTIKDITASIFAKYNVNFCYLFGSYSKNKANNNSDVDLLIDTDLTGLDFYGLVEELRQGLHKKIDLLKVNQLENNIQLITDVLKDGIKIYG